MGRVARLCLLRPGSLSRTDQKQIARSRSRDRHDRGAVLACSRLSASQAHCAYPAVSGGAGGAENRNAPNGTAALSFVANSEAARYVFVVVAAADVVIAGRRYDTTLLCWRADRGDWLFCVKRHKWEVVRAARSCARSWRVQWRSRRSEANRGAIGRTRGSNVSSLAKIGIPAADRQASSSVVVVPIIMLVMEFRVVSVRLVVLFRSSNVRRPRTTLRSSGGERRSPWRTLRPERMMRSRP